MFGIGHMPELVALLVVALIILGPGKLPSFGASLGRGIRDFKREVSAITEPVREDLTLPEGDRSNRA